MANSLRVARKRPIMMMSEMLQTRHDAASERHVKKKNVTVLLCHQFESRLVFVSLFADDRLFCVRLNRFLTHNHAFAPQMTAVVAVHQK